MADVVCSRNEHSVDGAFDLWVVKRAVVEVPVSVSGTADLASECTVCLSEHLNVQEKRRGHVFPDPWLTRCCWLVADFVKLYATYVTPPMLFQCASGVPQIHEVS